jgi:acetylglutamate kinase
VGLSGVDGGLLEAIPHPDSDLGFVGEAGAIQGDLLLTLVDAGFVPVVAPMALDAKGQLRNVNADTVCGAIAGALRAEVAIFLTDVPGVLDAHGTVLSHLTQGEVEALIEEGQIRGGMVPKARACLAALAHGARKVCIADGRSAGMLPGMLARKSAWGTIISADDAG